MTTSRNKGRNHRSAEAETLPINDETLARLVREARESQGEEARTEATTLTKVLKVCVYVGSLLPDDQKKVTDQYTLKKGRPTMPELERYAPVLKMALGDVSATLRTRFAKALHQLETSKNLSLRGAPEADIINTVGKSGGVSGLANAFDAEVKSRQLASKSFAETGDWEFEKVAKPIFSEAERRGWVLNREDPSETTAQPAHPAIVQQADQTEHAETSQ